MTDFTGENIVIDRPIMGMVTTHLSAWQRGRPLIFLAKSTDDLRKLSYRPWLRSQIAACILADHLSLKSENKLPHILRLPQERCEDLDDGDVVLLDSEGFTILYKMGSPHNSILSTNRCNCKCIMCPQPSANDPENLLDNNLKLISLLDPKNTECLGITGGEPTLLGSGLIKLIQACREKLPNTSITLLTNGKKLKDFEFTRDLVLAGFPNLRLEIPLFADNDTEHDDIMGAKGSFYDTIEGLYNLARLGQPVGLRTVLHSLTIGRLLQYSEFIYRNLPFVVHVAFMGMETIGLAKDNLDSLWVDPFDYQEQLSSAVKYLTRRMVPVSIYNHQLCIIPHDLWSFCRRSITSWKQTYLPICDACSIKDSCGGIFITGKRHSTHLHPL